jgi:carbonic anhydrase/acetyltransferase-like protein (isoleucine patch superfamily)
MALPRAPASSRGSSAAVRDFLRGVPRFLECRLCITRRRPLPTAMALYAIDDKEPSLAPSAWVADDATVVGDVGLADQASLWFGVVARGDNEPIRIGARSNVQENAVLHVDPGFPLEIGADVTVGHLAMLHGCTIGDCTLIGIGAVVMNGARIGRHCIVGAGALVTEGKEFPDGSLIVGSPAQAVRTLTEAQQQRVQHAADVYVARAARYKRDLRRIS